MPKRKKRKKIEHGAFTKLASFTSSAIKEYKNKYSKTLFGDDLEDLKGQQVYWDDKKTKSIAENICVAVGGEDKHGKWPIMLLKIKEKDKHQKNYQIP